MTKHFQHVCETHGGCSTDNPYHVLHHDLHCICFGAVLPGLVVQRRGPLHRRLVLHIDRLELRLGVLDLGVQLIALLHGGLGVLRVRVRRVAAVLALLEQALDIGDLGLDSRGARLLVLELVEEEGGTGRGRGGGGLVGDEPLLALHELVLGL